MDNHILLPFQYHVLIKVMPLIEFIPIGVKLIPPLVVTLLIIMLLQDLIARRQSTPEDRRHSLTRLHKRYAAMIVPSLLLVSIFHFDILHTRQSYEALIDTARVIENQIQTAERLPNQRWSAQTSTGRYLISANGNAAACTEAALRHPELHIILRSGADTLTPASTWNITGPHNRLRIAPCTGMQRQWYADVQITRLPTGSDHATHFASAVRP